MPNLTYKDVQGTYHIADDTSRLYEPSRNSTFDFVCTNIDGIVNSTSPNNSTIANVQEVLRLSVQRTSVPNFTIAPTEIRRGNSVIKAAGQPSFEAGQMTIQDYIGAKTKDILLSWQALAYNVKNDQIGYMSDYKRDCYLLEYDVSFRLIRSWLLKGCWISALSEGEFDKTSNDLRQITVTLQYDRAIPEQNEDL